MILAAGRGKRMRPLTDQLPKPLLKAGDRRLIDWSVDGLVRAGVNQIVINTAHLSETFLPALGTHYRGADIHYSVEGKTYDESLETLGGIAKALPLLSEGDEPFIVVAGDIATHFDFSALTGKNAQQIRQRAIGRTFDFGAQPGFSSRRRYGIGQRSCDEKLPDVYLFEHRSFFAPNFPQRADCFCQTFPLVGSIHWSRPREWGGLYRFLGKCRNSSGAHGFGTEILQIENSYSQNTIC